MGIVSEEDMLKYFCDLCEKEQNKSLYEVKVRWTNIHPKKSNNSIRVEGKDFCIECLQKMFDNISLDVGKID